MVLRLPVRKAAPAPVPTEALRQFMTGTCYRASLLLESSRMHGWSPSLSPERVQAELENTIGYIALLANENNLNHVTWIDDSGASQAGEVIGIGGNVDLEEGVFDLRLAVVDPAAAGTQPAIFIAYERVVDLTQRLPS